MAPSLRAVLRRVRAWPRHLVLITGGMALVLVGARLALPSVLEHLVNRRLAHIPGYAGRVGDIDVALWRGAYVLHDLDIRRTRGKVREPFFRAREIDFSLAWRELFHGKVVSDIHATGAQLTVVTGRDVTRSQTDLDRRWQNVAESLFPIDITHLEISDGLIRYIDRTRDPAVDLFVTRVRLKATGLRNRRGEDGGGEFPADISLEGTSLGAGHLTARLRAEPLAPQPHFHLGLKLTDVNLPAINPSLKAYANVDVSHGIFRLVVEMAGRDGAFRGYAKPFFEDLDFKNLADEHEGPGHAIWESVVAFVTDLVKNHPRDQLATRIPFRGRFGDAQVGFLATIRNVFRHGFVRAFNPTIEHSVHADKVNPDGTRRAGKN